MPESLLGQTRPSVDALVAIVSRWPEFLRLSRAILVAAGLDPNALSFRDARERGWKKGLGAAALIVTDAVVASQLPAGSVAQVFRIISDRSIIELREHVEHSFG